MTQKLLRNRDFAAKMKQLNNFGAVENRLKPTVELTFRELRSILQKAITKNYKKSVPYSGEIALTSFPVLKKTTESQKRRVIERKLQLNTTEVGVEL